jgi:sulfur carrier protein ThiS
MVVNDVAPRVQYTATAGQTAFSIPFEFLENDDVTVLRNGAVITRVASPSTADEYSLIGVGSSGGGSCLLGAGATLADVITIYRTMDFARATDFPVGGPFSVAALNEELDSNMLLMRQLEEDFVRSMRVPVTDLSSDLVIPDVNTRKSKWLAFDLNGTPMAVAENGQSVITGMARAVTQSDVTATEGQTVFTISYEVGTVFVSVNGLIVPKSDYTATNGSQVIFTDGLSAGDTVSVIQLSAS